MARKWWDIEEDLTAIAFLANAKQWILEHLAYLLFAFTMLVCLFPLWGA